MSNEERARISRENGAKSKGATSPEGKAKVSANAVKTGEHVKTLTQFLPPHQAVLCNEDRPQYYQLLKQLIEIYRPANQLAATAVRDIAIAQWQIERLHTCVTVQWNLALIDNAAKPTTLAPELFEIQTMGRAAEQLIGGKGAVSKLNREIAQLQRSIAGLERRLKFIHGTFPNVAKKLTQEENSQPPEKEPLTEPPIYTTESSPAVLQAYKQQFPNREIVVLPPDDVANGLNLEDDMPTAPRNSS